jgi:hypothetical protein
MIAAGRHGLAALLLGQLASAAWAAHPLITEDAGTQGAGHFQLELTSEQGRLHLSGADQYIALTSGVLSYGMTDTVDVLISVPHLRFGASTADGTPGEAGLSDVGLDIKWRFFERDRLSMAVKRGSRFRPVMRAAAWGSARTAGVPTW